MALQHNNLDPTFSVGILLRYALIFRDVAARGKQSALVTNSVVSQARSSMAACNGQVFRHVLGIRQAPEHLRLFHVLVAGSIAQDT